MKAYKIRKPLTYPIDDIQNRIVLTIFNFYLRFTQFQ